MKKILSIIFAIGLFSLSGFSTNAAEVRNTPNQAADHLILSVLGDEISKAVASYYKQDDPNSLFIVYGHGNSKDFVNVLQSEKGHELDTNYVVKVDITPQKKGILGKDTISFGIDQSSQSGNMKIKLLDYQHVDPKDK
ncbi:DUF3888 domain-containing protein [Niallia taxi]|nr:DUF3888 domain-containing protein [Niallia taxi]MDE5055222.1 DUF3888 domain-containing protein [Niallia taxi]